MILYKNGMNLTITKNNDSCCDILDMTINVEENKFMLMLVYMEVTESEE